MFIGHLYVLFGEMSIWVLCPFFLSDCLVSFLVLSCVMSLHILIINPLWNVSLVNIFSPSVGYLSFCWWFPLLCKSFVVWCSPVSFVFFAWGDISKKILLWVMSKSLLSMFSSKEFLIWGLIVFFNLFWVYAFIWCNRAV